MNINMDSIMKKAKTVENKLEGNVSLNRLFSDEFVKQHSSYNNIKELLSDANLQTQENFEEWYIAPSSNDYIKERTDFNSVKDMFSKAVPIFARKKLNAINAGTWMDETFESDDVLDNIYIHINPHIS